MGDSQKTRSSLLVRIRDARDDEAWCEFVDVYAPLVYRFARLRGLQNADAADVTQDVLQTVARTINGFQYDPERGSFRGWLLSVARSRLCDLIAGQQRQAQGSGDTRTLGVLEQQPSGDDEENFLEREFRKCVFEWAAERVRNEFEDSTWQAFWQTNVEGRAIKQVAESLGMTVGAVYAARSRVLARLKAQVEQLEE